MIKCGTSHSLLGIVALLFGNDLMGAALNLVSVLPQSWWEGSETWYLPLSNEGLVIVLVASLFFSWGVLFHYYLAQRQHAHD